MSLKQNNFFDLFMNELEKGCIKLNVAGKGKKVENLVIMKINEMNGRNRTPTQRTG